MNQIRTYPSLVGNKGFTLIEVMIVSAIIALLASIAYPSYQRYLILNAERQAQSALKQMSADLERWRASRLTFRGFLPMNCATGERCYDESNTTLYIPIGSNNSNYRYKVILTNMASDSNPATNSASLIASGSDVNQAVGRQWQMVAIPNPGLTKAPTIYLNSQRTECKTIDSTLGIDTIQTTHTCGTATQSKNW